MPEGLRKNLIFIIIFSVLLYLGMSFYSNINEVLRISSQVTLTLVLTTLLLSYLNYLSRFWKWHYYIRLLKLPLSLKESYLIFMSALSLSVTPGKVGEILKSWLIKSRIGVPVAETAPIVLVERITDFFSLLMIAGLGAAIYGYGIYIVLVIFTFFVVLTAVLARADLVRLIAGKIARIKKLEKISELLIALGTTASALVKPVPLILMTLVSLIAWGFECLSYYIILSNFTVGITVFWSAYAYALATIVGAVSFLPGGLGLTEGTLYFLLLGNGGSKEIAATTTFLIRIATLWFAVLVGTIHLSVYQRKYDTTNNI